MDWRLLLTCIRATWTVDDTLQCMEPRLLSGTGFIARARAKEFAYFCIGEQTGLGSVLFSFFFSYDDKAMWTIEIGNA